MITDEHVFSDAYEADLKHRESELEALRAHLKSAYWGGWADNVVIYGKSGVGKTLTARHIVNRLRDRAQERGKTSKQAVAATKIRGLDLTYNQVLFQAIHHHPREVVIHTNSPREKLEQTLKRIVDEPYVIVLDEADGLRDFNVVRQLIETPQVSVVAITHDLEDWTDLTYRAGVTGFHDIEFTPYSTEELTDILEPRAAVGLDCGVSREQLHRIADDCGGLARRAIMALWAAGEIAEERDGNRITDQDIAKSYDRARRKERQAQLDSLPVGHQLAYELLRQAGGRLEASSLKQLWIDHVDELYAGRDQEAVTWARARQYYGKMEGYDLVDMPATRHGEYETKDMDVVAEIDLPGNIDLIKPAQ